MTLSISPIRTVRICALGTDSKETRTEIDSHADTCVVCKETALIFHDYETQVRVHGYKQSLGAAVCRTVSAAVAYDHPSDGSTYFLIVHQAIEIPNMKTNLLSPMQLRDIGIRVNDEPKHMVLTPTDYHHAITVPPDGTREEELVLPLSLHGVTSFIPTRRPTTQEFEAAEEWQRIGLTAEASEWDPTDPRFNDQEQAMLDHNGKLRDESLDMPQVLIASIHVENPRRYFTSFGEDLKATRHISSVRMKQRLPRVSAETLAKRWNIGLSKAQRTLEATTQSGVRTVLHPTLSRRFRTNDRQLRYRRLAHNMFTDTLEASKTSWFRKNKYAQVFVTSFGWTRVFPMQKKSEAHHGLDLLAQRDGVPPTIIMDGSKEQTLGEFRRKAREMGCRIKQTEPRSPWQNAAEGGIREVKRGAGRKAAKKNSPAKLWDHCLELEGYVRSNTALDQFQLQGEVPETIVSGQTADISPFIEYEWYDWVRFWDTKAPYPDHKEIYGRWLGPAVDIGPAMTAKILQDNGHVIYTSSHRALNEHELNDPEHQRQRDLFDKAIRKKLGAVMTEAELAKIDPDAVTPTNPLYQDDFEGTHDHTDDIDDATPEYKDLYIGAEVKLSVQGEPKSGKVVRRARTDAGELYGRANDNPILDSRAYDVDFGDGDVRPFTANVIAENMYAQSDFEGHKLMLLESIVDHKTNGNEVTDANRYVTHHGRKYPRKTTKGWELCCEWRDGSTSWEPLSSLKESYPVEIAEYAVSRGIEHMPAFDWWIKRVLKKRDRIIAAVNKRYFRMTHKFGIELPKTVKRALEIDNETGTTFWADAIAKEMEAVRIAFKILSNGEEPPPTYQFMECHMVFDIKIENFRRKARLVAGGHMTRQPDVPTYASVVSRETVRIALTLAALNDLQVKTSDIQNAYLASPCEEKIHTILGPEFGPDKGKKAIIVRALYGLKSAGSSFGRHIADCMRTLGYVPCKADPDLWMKPMVRPEDGFEYFAYILLYVDDALSVHHDAEGALREIDQYFPMKKGSIGDPDIYLGAKLRKVQLNNGVFAWAMSPSKYVQEAVSNIEKHLNNKYEGRKLPKRATAPWRNDYVSELDETPELSPDHAQFYQSQVGTLHWMVELGRVDMITEVSKLASHMALPREGHLDAVLHTFSYLKKKHNSRMVFDPTYPEIDQSKFQTHDWTRLYGDVTEPKPVDMPEPRGKEVDLRLFVDADFAGDQLTRRSRTGFFVYLNSAPIAWLSKRQTTVETSVFGSEFVAMKQGVDTLRGIRYKLRMMGVPITGPTYIFGDNMSVIHNTQRPESTLKKKSNQVCFHAVRESVAMGESLTAHIDTHSNPADLATKMIPGGQKRDRLVDMLLYDIAEDH